LVPAGDRSTSWCTLWPGIGLARGWHPPALHPFVRPSSFRRRPLFSRARSGPPPLGVCVRGVRMTGGMCVGVWGWVGLTRSLLAGARPVDRVLPARCRAAGMREPTGPTAPKRTRGKARRKRPPMAPLGCALTDKSEAGEMLESSLARASRTARPAGGANSESVLARRAGPQQGGGGGGGVAPPPGDNLSTAAAYVSTL